jgi:hypothetical protein
MARSPVSKIDALTPDLMHQRRPPAVAARPIRSPYSSSRAARKRRKISSSVAVPDVARVWPALIRLTDLILQATRRQIKTTYRNMRLPQFWKDEICGGQMKPGRNACSICKARNAPSPRLRGEGRGEGRARQPLLARNWAMGPPRLAPLVIATRGLGPRGSNLGAGDCATTRLPRRVPAPRNDRGAMRVSSRGVGHPAGVELTRRRADRFIA